MLEAFPGGLSLYGSGPTAILFFNWNGTVTWSRPEVELPVGLPRPQPEFGEAQPLIAVFQHSSDLSEFTLGQTEPTPLYFALEPPRGDVSGRLVVAWFAVTDRDPQPDMPPPARNTWQLIISDYAGPGDYRVEMRFNRCEWLHGFGRPDALPVIGFDSGESLAERSWMHAASLTADMSLLCALSNNRQPGVYRYEVIDGIPMGCGIDRNAPPGRNRCADRNQQPGDSCSPACYVEPDDDLDGRYEGPSPDSPDPLGVYDDCVDVGDPACNDDQDGDGFSSLTDCRRTLKPAPIR